MAVFKDDNGTYYYQTRIKLRTGKIKQAKGRGFASRKEAKLAEAKRVIEAEDEVQRDTTFADAAEDYLTWYKNRRKASSYQKVEGILKTHLIPQFGKKALTAIKPAHVARYQEELIAKYSVNHVKKIHVVLSSIFNHAIKYDMTTSNPASRAGNVELEEHKRMEFYTLEEFKQFIRMVDDPLYTALFMTLYYGGVRKGELLALTWGDIDFDNNTINVNKTVYNKKVTSPKNHSSIRTLLMPSFVMRLLSQLRAEQLSGQMDFVVFGEVYDHISTTTLDRKYAEWVEFAKVKKIRLHDFRHSHASYLINKNVPVAMIAKRLGHKDVSTTLNTYAHLYPSTEKEAVLSMEDDFKPAQVLQFKQ